MGTTVFCCAISRIWPATIIARPEGTGAILGAYPGRRDVTKALEKIAYGPEPQWYSGHGNSRRNPMQVAPLRASLFGRGGAHSEGCRNDWPAKWQQMLF